MIHSTAIVSPKAKLGVNVQVGPFAIIDETAVIGDNCVIGPRAHLEYCVIGPDNQVGEGALIGAPPQDLKYKNEPTSVAVGSGNVFREYVTIHRATHAGESTKVGDRCFFMANAHVAHDCTVGSQVILVNGVAIGGHCTVYDQAFLSAFVAVHQFCRIGRNAMIGANLKLSKDIPPFVTVGGDDDGIHGLNKVGLKRAGFTRERINILENLYSIYFREKLMVSEAVKKIEMTLPQNDDVRAFLDFIKNSKRGIER